MATFDFRFRLFVVCVLLVWVSTAEELKETVDGWRLPDARAVVGKLFRYTVTSNQPCAAHYKVYSTHL